MTYGEVAESLHINRKTATKACEYQGGKLMFWPLSIYGLMQPKETYAWARIRIMHETSKAVLVDNGAIIWISKSRIRKIRLKNNVFEIYIKESTVG